MSEGTEGYFHCGRCGRFFRAELGGALIRRCRHCGGDPALALADRCDSRLPAEAGDVVRGMTGGAPRGRGESGVAVPEPPPEHHHHRQAHRHQRSNPVLRRLVIFIGLWVILLGAFAVGTKVANDRREREELERTAEYKRARGDSPEGRALGDNARNLGFLREVSPACQQALTEFLQAATPEARLQRVCDPLRVAGPMSRFYQVNPAYLPGDSLVNDYLGVIETSAGPVVEGLWDGSDGRRIEASFRNMDGEWRLDWEAFVRFSEVPWVMFVAGGGQEVQEFRLLARERLAEERRHKPTISLVLHPPRFGVPDEPGPVSPEFELPRLSDAGRKLDALFKMKRAGGVPLGARVPVEDPEDMIRVRVRVRRIDEENSRRRFEIEEVLAGHWLAIEETGIPEPGDAEAPGSGG